MKLTKLILKSIEDEYDVHEFNLEDINVVQSYKNIIEVYLNEGFTQVFKKKDYNIFMY